MKITFCNISSLVLLALFSWGCSSADSSSDYYLFAGTYTGEGSEGIYLYRFDSSDGSFDSLGSTSGVENPSYLALSPDHSYLYAVNELADSAEATVSSFAFDREEERLTFLNKQSTLGGAPCYVSVDKTGKAVFVGNYLGGSVTMFPVEDDGSLQGAAESIRHSGSSVNESRQKAPHVHCTYVSPDNRTLVVNDLGTDRVYGYAYDSRENSLESAPVFVYEAEPGAGPRHLTYHPNGNYAYLINELNGSIVAFESTDTGLRKIQTVSTLPENFSGAISGADIRISPDGRFLYATNRESLNNIVIYAVDRQMGTLERVGSHGSGGVHPRNFIIDPTGQFLLVANRETDNIVIFRRDKDNGMLTPTGKEIELSQPVCLKMIPA